jgi:putative heme-binding domain-containing protein
MVNIRRQTAIVMLACAALGSGRRAQQPPPDPVRLETGARLYATHCATCHGPNGDLTGGVNLRTGQFKRASTDLDLMNTIVQGVPGTAMPATPLASGDLVAIVTYLRRMNDYGARKVVLGDPVKGQTIFEGKGGCLSCHRVDRKGSYAAPDLSEIGASRPAAVLEDTLLDPDATAQPGNRSIRAVTKNGTVITGRHLNEDTWTVQIIDSHEQLVSLWKPDLKEYTILKSSMPSYKDTLTPAERSDLLAYLVSLQPSAAGPGRGRGAGRAGPAGQEGRVR